MKRIAITIIVIAYLGLFLAAIVFAQDAMTPEQRKAKCAAEGGCLTITVAALIQLVTKEAEDAYKQGAASCGKTI